MKDLRKDRRAENKGELGHVGQGGDMSGVGSRCNRRMLVERGNKKAEEDAAKHEKDSQKAEGGVTRLKTNGNTELIEDWE